MIRMMARITARPKCAVARMATPHGAAAIGKVGALLAFPPALHRFDKFG